jgi:hypothetical protein
MKLIRYVSFYETDQICEFFLVFGVVIAEISFFWDMLLCKRLIGS